MASKRVDDCDHPIVVAHVIDSLQPGGGEQVCLDVMRLFAKNDHVNARLVTLTDRLDLLGDNFMGLDIRSCPSSSKGVLPRLFHLWKNIRGVDLIHVHMRHNLKYVRSLGVRGQRIVFHDHFGEIGRDVSVPPGFRLQLRDCHYLGVSKSLTDWATEHVGLDPAHVHLLPNIRYLEQSTARLVQFEHPAKWRFVMVSNHRPQKNIEHAIRLLAMLRPDLDASLTIYGWPIDQAYSAFLKETVVALGLSSFVTFIENENNVCDVLDNYDLALHSAHSESGPLVLIEYLAAGIPFVSFSTGDVSTRIAISRADFFVFDHDMDTWKSRVMSVLLGDQTEHARNKLRILYKTQFSPMQYKSSLLAIYEQILNAKRKAKAA